LESIKEAEGTTTAPVITNGRCEKQLFLQASNRKSRVESQQNSQYESKELRSDHFSTPNIENGMSPRPLGSSQLKLPSKEASEVGGWRLEAGGWRLEEGDSASFESSHVLYHQHENASLKSEIICLSFAVPTAFI